jgi:signal transduction histidine kinase
VRAGALRSERELSPVAVASLGVAGLALGAVSGVVADSGNAHGSAAVAVGRGVMVLLPIVIGVFIWQRLPDRRFGRLLVLGGLFNMLAALSGSGDALLYSAGRVATWLAEIVLFYLLLSFPSGRLRQPIDRLLFGAVSVVVLVLFVPTALLTDAYPVPSIWTTCTAGCPSNAFQVLAHEPSWVDQIVVPLRESLAAVLCVAVILRLVARIAEATTPMRRSLTPVLGGAVIHAVALPAAFGVRRADGATGLALTLTWVLAAGLPILAVGFLLGALRWRFTTANALYRMASQLQRRRDPQTVRGLLAETLEDPSLDLVMRGANGRWRDSAGTVVTLPSADARRAHTLIHDGDADVAAIVHDEALGEQRAFVEVAGAFAMMALANDRLSAKVEDSLQEVRESRERILSAAYDERRRIERDLHDGAQQRLVALQIKLDLASERSRAEHLPDAGQLHELTDEVGEALEDMRSLAAGVYPAVLADYGLYDALRAAARRSPVPVTVATGGVGRQSQDVEAAIYFCCLEALQNAAKHARARSIAIVVTDGDDVRFEIRDDGRGFDADHIDGGRGLTNIRDRVAAVGGSVVVESHGGTGTRIAGTIPHVAP